MKHKSIPKESNLEKFPRLEKLFELAEPYSEKNDLGVGHTKRVLKIAKQNFKIPQEMKEFVFAAIILHDIGGRTVKE